MPQMNPDRFVRVERREACVPNGMRCASQAWLKRSGAWRRSTPLILRIARGLRADARCEGRIPWEESKTCAQSRMFRDGRTALRGCCCA
jgi:hypothetical protein